MSSHWRIASTPLLAWAISTRSLYEVVHDAQAAVNLTVIVHQQDLDRLAHGKCLLRIIFVPSPTGW